MQQQQQQQGRTSPVDESEDNNNDAFGSRDVGLCVPTVSGVVGNEGSPSTSQRVARTSPSLVPETNPAETVILVPSECGSSSASNDLTRRELEM